MDWLDWMILLAWLGLVIVVTIAAFEIASARYACAHCGKRFITLNGVKEHQRKRGGYCNPLVRESLKHPLNGINL